MYLVPVESQAIWDEYAGFWGRDCYGVDFSPVRDYAVAQRYVLDCSDKANRLADSARAAYERRLVLQAVAELAKAQVFDSFNRRVRELAEVVYASAGTAMARAASQTARQIAAEAPEEALRALLEASALWPSSPELKLEAAALARQLDEPKLAGRLRAAAVELEEQGGSGSQ